MIQSGRLHVVHPHGVANQQPIASSANKNWCEMTHIWKSLKSILLESAESRPAAVQTEPIIMKKPETIANATASERWKPLTVWGVRVLNQRSIAYYYSPSCLLFSPSPAVYSVKRWGPTATQSYSTPHDVRRTCRKLKVFAEEPKIFALWSLCCVIENMNDRSSFHSVWFPTLPAVSQEKQTERHVSWQPLEAKI